MGRHPNGSGARSQFPVARNPDPAAIAINPKAFDPYVGPARCDPDNFMSGQRWFGGNDHFTRWLNHGPLPNHDPAATSCD